jgi:hypothetical protein
MSNDWIKQTLIAQAAEIAAAGHAGWGNTMLEAADRLTAQENALGFLRQISEQQAYEINQQAATIAEQARDIEALRAAVLAERDACAALCDQRSTDHWHDYKTGPMGVKGSARSEHRSGEAEHCAAAIRVRKAVTP